MYTHNSIEKKPNQVHQQETKQLQPAEKAIWPKISVVTPSYNQGQFIGATICSVLQQDYPDLEYIIIDGGSTDRSAEIIHKYESQLAYWVSEADRGQSHAINKGFQRATGEIIAWLNSDDMFRPGALFAAAKAFQQHPGAGLIYAYSAICDETGTPTKTLAGKPYSPAEMILGSNCVAQPSAFFRRTLYHQVGGLDENLHFNMDFDLWLRMGLVSEVVFVDDVWSNFRYYPESKSGRGKLPFEEECYQIVERVLQQPEMADHFHTHKPAIMAGLSKQLAFRHYQLSNTIEARQYALQAVRQYPSILKEKSSISLLLKCLIGRKVITQMKSLP